MAPKVETSFGENSNVRLGLVIALGSLFVAAIFGAAMWAGTIATDVSHIRANIEKLATDHEGRIRALEAKRP